MQRLTGGRRDGFTLIELLIVVAIIAVIAAIGVPALLRARISANEAAAIGDIRTVHSAQTAYAGPNAGYYESNFNCLAAKGGCIPGAPANSPSFLDQALSSLQPKQGYTRSTPEFGAAAPPTVPAISPTSVSGYVYVALPLAPMTGTRGFAGDHSGLMCFTADGTQPPTTGTGSLAPCQQLK